MIQIKSSQQLKRLRRLALASQGLLQAEAFGRGLSAARRAIEHMGYVQLDTISVVERAHHHVLHTRVPGFKPGMLEQMMQDRDVFEYWSHAAAVLPVEDFRFSLPYKQAIKRGQIHWYKNPDQKLMTALLARIRSDGPLRSRDLEVTSKNKPKGAGWWDWKPAKKALEQLYMQGDLMVSKREGFQKSYDLTERVLPAQIDTRMPSTEEFAAHLLDQQLRCHGLVSLKGLTYLRRNAALRLAMKNQLNERLAQGYLQAIQLPNNEVYWLESDRLEAPMPRVSKRLHILSPFDNSVIQRERLKALFQFDYQIECYVPAAKRQYGYFSLPLLYGDEFIGRMDCKAHRKARHLVINSLHFETHDHDPESVIQALVTALVRFRDFQQCDSMALDKVKPKNLHSVLHKALQQA
ncbi:winged helix-turn-helix domain-containing protein [Marinicella litoralis]|uniref:Winged helix-turn-helix domain-containing protein n=1 Tax=Marinicella litoralis TaxID=644220 RepID=A0A4R6XR78_9GAMM|nr:crosslink repair DNA glycosylase YcaQ family protein [Marinicella litoralis]TDR20387.1 hypothetical protein C8D91_1359 [Marinicella litoralis]